jgi:hypothetical protein
MDINKISFLRYLERNAETSDERNTEKKTTFEFEVSKENFDFMETWFEKPSEIEMIGGITVRINYFSFIYLITTYLLNHFFP